MSATTSHTELTATRLVRSAAALMLVSAAISAYWAVGGTGLLDTVGGSVARWGRDGGASVRLALAAVVVLKLVAAWLPARGARAPCPRAIRRLAWAEAAILIVYGGVLTGTGLAVQVGLIHAGADPDWRALDWARVPLGPMVPDRRAARLGGAARHADRRTGRARTPVGPWRAKGFPPTSAVARRHGRRVTAVTPSRLTGPKAAMPISLRWNTCQMLYPHRDAFGDPD